MGLGLYQKENTGHKYHLNMVGKEPIQYNSHATTGIGSKGNDTGTKGIRFDRFAIAPSDDLEGSPHTVVWRGI